jgi:hypothetical protein
MTEVDDLRGLRQPVEEMALEKVIDLVVIASTFL